MRFAFEDAPRPSHTNGGRVAWFIERLCTHSKGDLFGEPLTLEPWQRWLLDVIFEADPVTGERVWRDVTIMLPRGNGKSTLAAGLGFYFLIADDEGGAEVISAAYNDEQARVVWDTAATMREASPTLTAATRKFHSSIVHPLSVSSWKPISRKAAAAQGGNAHCVIFDEYHVQPTGELREVLRRGQKKRSRPMMLTITTEADSEQTPLGELQRGFHEVGVHEEVHPFLHVYRDRKGRSILIRWGIPWDAEMAKLDIRDHDLIRLCSPAEWIDPERVVNEGLDAAGQREAHYVQYDLNGLVRDASSEGVPMSMWDACAGESSQFADGADLAVGVDIGFRRDWSAVVAVGQSKAHPDRLAVQAWLFEPPRESGLELDLMATVGVAVEDLLETGQVKGICADPALAALLMQEWQRRGIEVREYRFAWGDAAPDSVALLAAIQGTRLLHDGDLRLRRHVSNLRVRTGPNGAWRWADHPLKQSSPDFPNDGGIALMLAVSEWERLFGEKPEVVPQFFF
jgi:phage terminase large subunit-like protein